MLRKLGTGTCLVALLTVASVGEPGAGTAAAAAKLELKAASANPAADLAAQVLKFWGDQVTQRTNGRITVKYFWAGSLLGSADMFNGLRDGIADVGHFGTASISGTFVDLAVLEVPFAYPLDAESIQAVQDQIDPLIERGIWEKNDLKHVFSVPSLAADPVTCKNKFLDSPEAWRGALVRTAGRWQAATLRNWGASPVVIPLNELYTSLQRGTVDCTLLVYTLLASFRIYEVAKYITRIDHSINYSVYLINRQVWERLPREDQQALVDAGGEARRHGDELRKDATARALETFKAHGVRLCTPDVRELRRLRDGADKVWEPIAKEAGPTGREIMSVLHKYRDKVAVGPTEGDTTPCRR
jgi:TRAP-type C4-dicarboxylate transport system substrate-binding protein